MNLKTLLEVASNAKDALERAQATCDEINALNSLNPERAPALMINFSDEINALKDALGARPELTINLGTNELSEKVRETVRLVIKREDGNYAIAFIGVKMVRGKIVLEIISKRADGTEIQHSQAAPFCKKPD